ncbi:hypothetical protein GOV13_01325 [Candidatus Pacearchaeota archaeon]|nr:hypothetical protein [Candidatus Pacearchaeota archaeon]
MRKQKESWMAGPYPWLVSTIAFALPSINYFRVGDFTGGAIFFISAVMFFVNFMMRVRENGR